MSSSARIFISYSRRGNGLLWKDRLLRQLAVFERHHLLDPWHDDETQLGDDWHARINTAMKSARLAVLLLTDEFLKSPFVLRHELPELQRRNREEGLIIAPIYCEKCDWEASAWISSLQTKPRLNAIPVPMATFSESNREHALRQFATEIAIQLGDTALKKLPHASESLAQTQTYLDKFPLTRGPSLREEKLIGREQELALLDLAFASSFGVPPSGGLGNRVNAGLQTAIVSLVAWGGVGKTMLVQHWLQRLQREGWFGARRVYAWSFYSQGTKEDRQASEDTFLAHALEWFGVPCEPTLSPWDKGRLLADAVARDRTLLILDGIEPLQYPPGPMGGQLRAPGVQSLLKQLARKANASHSEIGNALCLVTTREPLTDLADFQRREGSPWGSVLRVDLGNLTDEAGAALLHNAGVDRVGAQKIAPEKAAVTDEYLKASREIDGHALTLNLLGRFLARAHGGDIRRRDLVKFEEADRKEQGGTTFKMLAAFENWFANEGDIEARSLTIMRLLSLFDCPADEDCMAALRQPPILVRLTEPLFTLKRDPSTGQATDQPLSDKAWNDATHFLADFNLVSVQADSGESQLLLDCHPLIREYFAERLSKDNNEGWCAAHSRIFTALTEVADYQPTTLGGMEPLFKAVRHGCEAGLHGEVYGEILKERIDRGDGFAWRRLGAFGSMLRSLAPFLDSNWQPTKILLPLANGWLVDEAGLCLRALGRLEDALRTIRTAVETAVEYHDWISATTSACSASETSLLLGNLEEANREAELAISYAKMARGQEMVRSLPVLGDALHQNGRLSEARRHFREAEAIQHAIEPQFHFLYSVRGFRFHDFLLSQCERYAWSRQMGLGSWTTSLKAFFSRLSSRAKLVQQRVSVIHEELRGRLGTLSNAVDELTTTRACLYQAVPIFTTGSATNVEALKLLLRQVDSAVKGIRDAGTQHHLPSCLLTRSWVCFLASDTSGAQADLDEAWDIAERGPMRLHLADIHLYRARLFFREKPYPWQSPQDDLAAAEKLINDCGYHRRDQELADAKRAILGV